jgi:hypothetical protein
VIPSRFFLVFLLLVPLKVQGRPERVAVVGLKDSRVASHHLARAAKALSEVLRKEASSDVVTEQEVENGIRDRLARLLRIETTVAQDRYYHFRYEEAERLLAGREDPEALQLQGLIAYAAGDEKRSEQHFIRLLEIDPEAKLSTKDFPPKLVSLFEKIRGGKAGAAVRPFSLRLGKTVFVAEKSIASWGDKFRRWGSEMGWEKILLYRIEPIGWNYKMTAYLFPIQEKEETRLRAVEMVDLNAVTQAAEILVKSLFFIDTPSRLK